MARVLRIERDESRRESVVTLEGGEELTVALDAEETRGLAPGSVLEEDRLESLRQAAERKEMARGIFAWLDRRRRTRSWLRRKLIERGHPDLLADTVLDAFQEQGLVDDRDYARAWSADALRRKPVGRRWLQAKLQEAGVGEDDAWAGIDEVLPREEEPGLARRALERRGLDLRSEKTRAKAVRFLTGRGFSRELALDTLDAVRASDPDPGEDRLEGEF